MAQLESTDNDKFKDILSHLSRCGPIIHKDRGLTTLFLASAIVEVPQLVAVALNSMHPKPVYTEDPIAFKELFHSKCGLPTNCAEPTKTIPSIQNKQATSVLDRPVAGITFGHSGRVGSNVLFSEMSLNEAINSVLKRPHRDILFPNLKTRQEDEFLTAVPRTFRLHNIVWTKNLKSSIDPNSRYYNQLSHDEIKLCELFKIVPTVYLVIRETWLRSRQFGLVAKREFRSWFRLDVNKINALYTMFSKNWSE